MRLLSFRTAGEGQQLATIACFARLHDPQITGPVSRALGFGNDQVQRTPDRFRLAIAEHIGRGCVPEANDAGRIRNDYRFGRCVNHLLVDPRLHEHHREEPPARSGEAP